MLKDREVWEMARKYKGIAVRYGENYPVYECLFDGYHQCCVVLTDDPVSGVPNDHKAIAKSISQRCFLVSTKEALNKVFFNVVNS